MFMNARIVLPLAILTSIVSFSVGMSSTANAQDSTSGANLPDNESQAKARAALQADEVHAEVKAAPSTVAPAQESPGSEFPVSNEGPQPDTDAQAAARAAIRAESPAPAVQAAPVAAVASQEASRPPETTSAAPAVIEAPALPTTGSQQQQLETLLQDYRSDQISASDYHARRAEILAGN